MALLCVICGLTIWGSPKEEEEVVMGMGLILCLPGIGVGLLVRSAVLLSGGGLDSPGSGLILLRFAYNEGLSLSNVSH